MTEVDPEGFEGRTRSDIALTSQCRHRGEELRCCNGTDPGPSNGVMLDLSFSVCTMVIIVMSISKDYV